MANVNYDHQVL